jgi:hypothetical protein
MKYREKLLEFIFDDDLGDEALMDWIQSMPLLDQPDIFREFQALVTELAAEEGMNLTDDVPEMKNFSAFIDNYEDKILDEKLAEANLVMAQQDLDKSIREMDEAVDGVRNYVMDCIVNNEPNADAMRELAEKMMQSEKEHDMFDAENWSRIL